MRRRERAIVLAALIATDGVATGQVLLPPLPPPRPPSLVADVPLPPRRPADLVARPSPGPVFGPPMPARPVFGPPLPDKPVFGPPMPPRTLGGAAVQPPAGVPLAEELTCVRLFASGKVRARTLPPIPVTPEGCGVAAPIELSAVVLPAGQPIPIEPAVTIDCALGEAVADWVRDDLAPAFATTPAPLVGLAGTSGYACRGRNNIVGAKTSEHGRGNALDIGALRTADGRSIGVKQAGVAVLSTVKATACARFATVLGPGSDGFHESHLHVDLEPRRLGSKICHWDLP